MCGICGAFSVQPLSLDSMVYRLTLINHRGHESAGLATINDGGSLNHYVGVGSAREACHADRPGFRDFAERFENDKPFSFLGHTRYSTVGASDINHGQPLKMDHPEFGPFLLVHNGQLPQHQSLREELERRGQRFLTQSDTEVLAALIAHSECPSLPQAIAEIIQRIPGAYSLLALSRDYLVGARDRYGFWPLWYGQDKEQVLLASERPALGNSMNGDLLPPGAMIAIDRLSHQPEVTQVCDPISRRCWLDAVYLSRPDEHLGDSLMSKVRYALGQVLAERCPADADIVVGVPDSGGSAAAGFSARSGLLLESVALVRNRFAAGRSFILPGQSRRTSTIEEKLSVTKRLVAGQRVVVVDDSVIRSNTSRLVTRMLRDADAAEVHWRIAAPPVRCPCYYGIDIPNQDHLVANQFEAASIAAQIGSNSLQYLDLSDMLGVLSEFHHGWCTACITGDYPLSLA